MNNLLRRDSILPRGRNTVHAHIQVSLLSGRRTKGNLADCFHLFLQAFELGLLHKPPISTGRNGSLKPVKLLQLIISGVKQGSC